MDKKVLLEIAIKKLTSGEINAETYKKLKIKINEMEEVKFDILNESSAPVDECDSSVEECDMMDEQTGKLGMMGVEKLKQLRHLLDTGKITRPEYLAKMKQVSQSTMQGLQHAAGR